MSQCRRIWESFANFIRRVRALGRFILKASNSLSSVVCNQVLNVFQRSPSSAPLVISMGCSIVRLNLFMGLKRAFVISFLVGWLFMEMNRWRFFSRLIFFVCASTQLFALLGVKLNSFIKSCVCVCVYLGFLIIPGFIFP